MRRGNDAHASVALDPPATGTLRGWRLPRESLRVKGGLDAQSFVHAWLGRPAGGRPSALPAGEAKAIVWKDCQRIAMCSGCRPVYKCRSCSYQRTCAGGICGWGDVCVWGPYLKVLPRGARIIQVR